MYQSNGGNLVVNNVRLPDHVVLELQRLGRALEWYTAGELYSAVEACAVDRRLIDDPDGVNFMDKLELTDAEKRKAESKLHDDISAEDDDEDESTHSSKCKSRNIIVNFCKRLKESRMNSINQEKELCNQ